MTKTIISVVVMALWAPHASACLSETDRFAAGVVFNSYEHADFEVLEKLGTEGRHYRRQCPVRPAIAYPPVIVVKPNERHECDSDPVEITDVWIEGNVIALEVSYGGGCANHEFKLLADAAIAESEPPQGFLTLCHNANGDKCKAIVHETLRFDLGAYQDYIGDYNRLLLSVRTPESVSPTVSRLPWYPGDRCTYLYRPPESPYVVEVGFQSETPYLKVFLDSNIVYVRDPKPDYVEAELEFLTRIGALRLSRTPIETIHDSLTRKPANYWTAQDTVLPFNCRYERDPLTGQPGQTPLCTRSRCGSGYSYDPPPAPLPVNATGTREPDEKVPTTSTRKLRASLTAGSSSLSLTKPAPAAGTIRVLSLLGETLFQAHIIPGATHIPVPAGIRIPANAVVQITLGETRHSVRVLANPTR